MDQGNQPRVAQAFISIDPGALAGRDVYFERMETVIAEMLLDEGVRLAGTRRLALEKQAVQTGLVFPDALAQYLEALAGQVVT